MLTSNADTKFSDTANSLSWKFGDFHCPNTNINPGPNGNSSQFWSNQTDACMAEIKQTILWLGKECMELEPKDPHTNSPDWSSYISCKNSCENLVHDQSVLP